MTGAAIEGVPLSFVIKLMEAFLSDTKNSKTAMMREREFGGIHMKLVVSDHWSGFERFMLIGRDWQVGVNLGPPTTGEEEIYSVFASSLAASNAAVNGRNGFVRDMTVLRMTFSDWKMDHHDVD